MNSTTTNTLHGILSSPFTAQTSISSLDGDAPLLPISFDFIFINKKKFLLYKIKYKITFPKYVNKKYQILLIIKIRFRIIYTLSNWKMNNVDRIWNGGSLQKWRQPLDIQPDVYWDRHPKLLESGLTVQVSGLTVLETVFVQQSMLHLHIDS